MKKTKSRENKHFMIAGGQVLNKWGLWFIKYPSKIAATLLLDDGKAINYGAPVEYFTFFEQTIGPDVSSDISDWYDFFIFDHRLNLLDIASIYIPNVSEDFSNSLKLIDVSTSSIGEQYKTFEKNSKLVK